MSLGSLVGGMGAPRMMPHMPSHDASHAFGDNANNLQGSNDIEVLEDDEEEAKDEEDNKEEEEEEEKEEDGA